MVNCFFPLGRRLIVAPSVAIMPGQRQPDEELLELWIKERTNSVVKIQNADSLSTLMEVNVATPVSAKAHAFEILISMNEARATVKEFSQSLYFCQSCENSSPREEQLIIVWCVCVVLCITMRWVLTFRNVIWPEKPNIINKLSHWTNVLITFSNSSGNQSCDQNNSTIAGEKCKMHNKRTSDMKRIT